MTELCDEQKKCIMTGVALVSVGGMGGAIVGVGELRSCSLMR